MPISDWSSDVCSSDLLAVEARPFPRSLQHLSGKCDQFLKFVRGLAAFVQHKRERDIDAGLGISERRQPERHLDQLLEVIADRKSVVWGTRGAVRLDPGGGRILKTKTDSEKKIR